MCPFPTPPLLKNKSQHELDAALRCPFYMAPGLELTVPKHEIFCLLYFATIDTIWVGDLYTKIW
jgi:hypothetical protein